VVVAPGARAATVVVTAAISHVIAVVLGLLATVVSLALILMVAARLILAGLVGLRRGRTRDQERQRQGACEQMFHGISLYGREMRLRSQNTIGRERDMNETLRASIGFA
jgi:hypothetical protein